MKGSNVTALEVYDKRRKDKAKKILTSKKVSSEKNNKVIELYPKSKTKGFVYLVLGWVFFAASLIFVPLLFGAAAFIMGFKTFTEKSEAHGFILMFLAVTGTIFGSLYSFVVTGTMFI